jgi:predicted TIM-barrel fold metal-dependent hydrolase
MIWDLHCHLSGVEGRTVEERMSQLMVYADRMQVDRLVFFMGFPWSQEPTPDDLRSQNDQVLQALSHWHDRAFGFTYVSPMHVEASLAEIDRCIAGGPMVGVKLWVAARCSDEQIDPIIRRCHELKAAIFQHTWYKAGGNLPGESTPEDLAQLASRHPQTPLICGHTGGDWERGIRAVRGYPNVSIGLGGFDPTAGVTEMAVRELGAERVIYGSDIGGRSFASQLAKVQGADIPAPAKRLILGMNLKSMLLPILREKGVRVD